MRSRFMSGRLGIALALVLAVAACAQPESKPAPAPAKAGEATTAKPGAPPAQPAAGNVADTLTIAYPSNLETLDPHQTGSVLTDSARHLFYETLADRDPKTMALKPLLATSWRNLDPTTWEVKLRQGVKFANGEEFSAQHVKDSFERGLADKLNSSFKTYWGGSRKAHLADVEVVDAHTVRIKTLVPDPYVPQRLAPWPVAMVPKSVTALMDKYVTAPDQAIGTGPYRITEYVVGDRAVLERREDYWGEKPPTKKIVFRIIPDAQTRVAALQRGEIDVMVNLPVPLLPIVEKDPNLMVYGALGSTTHALLINTLQGGPLADARVRQALNYAVDKEAILKSLYAGRGKVLSSPVAGQIEGAVDAPYPYDPAKAKQLLAEAGYPNGFETTLQQATGRWPQAVEAAQAIAGYLEKVGVKAKLETVEWAEYNRIGSTHKAKGLFYYAFTNLMWEAVYPFERFMPGYARWMYYPASGEGLEGLKKLQGTFDPAQRKQIAQQVAKDLNQKAAWVYLYQLEEIFGLSKKVKNLVMRPDHELDLLQTLKEK